MKNLLLLCFFLFMAGVCLQATEGAGKEKRQPSEIISDFYSHLKGNEYLSIKKDLKDMMPLKTDVLTARKVYEELIKIVKDKSGRFNSQVKKWVIEQLLFYKLEGHKITNLETDLINVMLDPESGWYIQAAIIDKLPDALDPNDNFNRERLENSLIKIIDIKESISDKNRYVDVKRAAFSKLSSFNVAFKKMKSVVVKELKDKDSKLTNAILNYVYDYSEVAENEFHDSELERIIKGFISKESTLMPVALSKAIVIYANMINVEQKGKIQKSDRDLFIELLKRSETPVILAAAKSLHKIRSTEAVEPILEVLKKPGQVDNVIYGLLESIIYLQDALLELPDSSGKRKKEALVKIKEQYLKFIKIKEVKGDLREYLYDAIEKFGIQYHAYEYLTLADLKSLIMMLSSEDYSKEDKIRLSGVLTTLTSENFGANGNLWEQWAVEEEANTKSNRFR